MRNRLRRIARRTYEIIEIEGVILAVLLLLIGVSVGVAYFFTDLFGRETVSVRQDPFEQ